MNPEIEQLFSNKGISSGYALLDKEIGGWQNGDLIIIGSRPAVGKTAFAINIALNAAAGMNIPVLFFTLEMSSESLVKRMVIREAEINIKDIDGKHIIEKEDWPKVEKRLLEIHKCPLYIDDTPGRLVDDFAEKVGKVVKDKGVKMVIVDYLQDLVGPGTQNCFFHVMDQMYQKDKQIVLTCSQGLDNMKWLLEERLIEHCRWGTTIEIGKAE